VHAMQMTLDDWDRAKELFDAALALNPPQRASFLAEKCHEESLRQQVEKLLINYQEAGSFLDDPVLDLKIASPGEMQTEEATRPRQQSADLLTTATSVEAEDPMVGRQLGERFPSPVPRHPPGTTLPKRRLIGNTIRLIGS
jgi:hypothetical protein